MIRYSSPIYSIEISDEECQQAQATRVAFEDMLEKQEAAFEHLRLLSDSLTGAADSSVFLSMAKLFVQYRRKTKKLFNEFITQLEESLKALNETLSDSHMEKIRDTILNEVREIRDGVIEILEYLERPHEKTFIQDFTSTAKRLIERGEALNEIVTDELFGHLDEDILGELRLG